MRVAIIPARAGSKRIPRKNIIDFCGKPMIAWSIEAVLATNVFDRVVVSTDDDEIAEVATGLGAEAPFRRPSSLSDDYTGTASVVRHSLEWLRANDTAPSAVCCVYATAPLIDTRDIKTGLDLLESAPWQYVFSATSFAFPVQRALVKDQNGGMEPLFPEHAATRSQDLPDALHDAGQFYWGRTDAWLGEAQIYAPHSTVVMLPRWRVQDIDTPEDLDRARVLMRIAEEQRNG